MNDHAAAGTAIGVLGTGSYVPERVLGNPELAARLGVSTRWIEVRTGVRERRIAAPREATSDLAVVAAARAIESAGVGADDIDLIVLATSTPDQPIPATACTVQARLGIRRAVALDVDAVCTGFVYGLQIARAMLVTDDALRHALVIGADVYSRILDYTNDRTAVLFGDGGGAVVIGRTEEPGILYGRLGADGTKRDLVEIPAGGSRLPADRDTVAQGLHHFRMRGRAVREFFEEAFPRMLNQALAETGRQLADIDLIVPHQANMRLLQDCAKDNGVPPDQMFLCGERYGNTAAASVPLALDEAVRCGRILPGDEVLLMAFGGGMTWGGLLVHWGMG
jgi:acetoacetyl-CoA synthase